MIAPEPPPRALDPTRNRTNRAGFRVRSLIIDGYRHYLAGETPSWPTPTVAPSAAPYFHPTRTKGLCPRCLLQQGLDSDAISLARGGPPAPVMSLDSGPVGTSALARVAETIGPVPRVLLRDTEPATGPRSRRPARLARAARARRPRRPAPAPRRDRPRRHGRHPQGPRHRPGPRPGRQGPARDSTATTPSWSAASSRRRRSPASCSTPASCRSTSWAPSPTAGPTSP